MTYHLRHHTHRAEQRARDGTYRAEYAPGNADKRPELMLALLMAESAAEKPKDKPRFTYSYNQGRRKGSQFLVLTALVDTSPDGIQLSELADAARISTTSARSALRKAHAQGRVERLGEKRPYKWRINDAGRRYLDEKRAEAE